MIKIHHCRSCGQGFCDECSSKKKPVPERGWGAEPVRVCDNCFLKDSKGQFSSASFLLQSVLRFCDRIVKFYISFVEMADWSMKGVRQNFVD